MALLASCEIVGIGIEPCSGSSRGGGSTASTSTSLILTLRGALGFPGTFDLLPTGRPGFFLVVVSAPVSIVNGFLAGSGVGGSESRTASSMVSILIGVSTIVTASDSIVAICYESQIIIRTDPRERRRYSETIRSFRQDYRASQSRGTSYS